MSNSNRSLHRRMNLDSLETHNLMAADIGLESGILRVSGTDGNDLVMVQEVGEWQGTSLWVTVKNQDSGALLASRLLNRAAVQQIFLNGQSGNDTLIARSDLPVVIDGGAGNDSIEVVSKNSFVDGGSGSDNLVGTAALDCLYTAAGMETVLGKSTVAWGLTTQKAGGTSRFSCDEGWEYNGAWGY